MACGCQLDLIAMDILNKWLFWALDEKDDEKVKVTYVSARFAPFLEDSSLPHTAFNVQNLHLQNSSLDFFNTGKCFTFLAKTTIASHFINEWSSKVLTTC